MNYDLPTVTIFSDSYGLCHKISLPQVPPQYFFSIKRIVKGTVIPVHVMKAYGREEVQLHTFSFSAFDGVISYPYERVSWSQWPEGCTDSFLESRAG